MTDKDNEKMRDLLKNFEADTESLNTKTLTEVTDRDSIRVTESVNDAEWADEQVHSMLSYTEQEVDISAWLTKLLDDDRTFRNDM